MYFVFLKFIGLGNFPKFSYGTRKVGQRVPDNDLCRAAFLDVPF